MAQKKCLKPMLHKLKSQSFENHLKPMLHELNSQRGWGMAKKKSIKTNVTLTQISKW